ncbi:MAG: uncharacterized membrane protein YhaH (DUF805 family) [Neolewinella sp.]|jgi:uncharacterized membrane protein YhaH (DUF805 family)
MIEYYKTAISKYADFTGRARRSEYWFFALGNFLIYIGLAFLGGMIAGATGSETAGIAIYGLLVLFYLGIIIPTLSCGVRRMHDAGRSGWWIIVPIVSFIFAVSDSEPGANKWGPNPKTGAVAGAASHLVD